MLQAGLCVAMVQTYHPPADKSTSHVGQAKGRLSDVDWYRCTMASRVPAPIIGPEVEGDDEMGAPRKVRQRRQRGGR